jgi:hypothetical protein
MLSVIKPAAKYPEFVTLQLGEAPAKNKNSSIATVDAERVSIDLGIAVTLAGTIEVAYYVNVLTSPDGHLRPDSFIGSILTVVFCGVLVPPPSTPRRPPPARPATP